MPSLPSLLGAYPWLGAPKVNLVAGGSLVLIALPEVLPMGYHRTAVAVRLFAIVFFLSLWVVICLFYASAPAFFEGNC